MSGDRSADRSRGSSELRAEELILEVYRQRQALVGAGTSPARVIMSRAHYDAIQRYHAMLGDLPEGSSDYIDRYRLFDLEICVEDVDAPRVE